MNVMLINPAPKIVVEDFFERPKYPHIGIGCLAGYLESRGINCKVIDAKLERINAEEVLKRVADAEIVGITSFTHEIKISAELAGDIKKEYPEKITVIGGIHASILPKETLEAFPEFDFLVHGEGEETAYELFEAISKNKGFEEIKGVAFRKGGKVVVNSPRERIKNLDELPLPAWHLFPRAEEYPILTSRGCPFQCIFCTRAHGNVVRKRSPENVVKELELVVNKFGTRYVYVYDETFTVDLKRAEIICNLIIEKGLHRKFKWEAETRVNCITFDALKKMKEAGCVLVKFGVESGNPEILKVIKKGITLEQVEKAVKMAKKAGLKTQGLFIIGHPNETRKTANDTINFAVKLNTTEVAFGIMVPYPGTEVAEMAKRGEGGYKILSMDWSDYNKQLGNALELKTLSRKEMEKLQLKAYAKFYFRNFKVREIIKNLVLRYKLIFALLKNTLRRNADG